MSHRRYVLLLAYALATIPFILWGAWHALKMHANSPLEWVPESFPARHDYEDFRRAFGNGDVVVASWPGCALDDARLTTLSRVLRQSKPFLTAEGEPLFERIVTGREVYEQLLAPPVALSPDEAVKRLTGTWLGRDGRTTCLVVTFTPEALADRARLVNLIRLAAQKRCELPEADLHLAGPVLDGLEVDQAGKKSLDSFAAPSAAIVAVLCVVFLRTWRGAVAVFLLSVYCEAATLAFIHYCGDTMSALLIVLPPLIQGAAVSGGIHLVNYYYDAAREHGVQQAVHRAFSLAWLPCALSAGTTAIGLVSLAACDLVPIRAFGAYGGAGMLLTTCLLLSIVPATFAIWPPVNLGRGTAAESGDHDRLQPRWSMWGLLARGLRISHVPVIAISIGAMAGLGLGMTRVQTSVRIETLFPRDSRLMRDYAWLEEHVAPLVPIEIIMRFGSECQLSLSDRLELVSRAERKLATLDEVAGTTSAATFVPRFELRAGAPPAMAREAVGRGLSEARRGFVAANYLHETSREQLWRITARVSALDNIDYGEFLAVVQERLEPVLRGGDGRNFAGTSFKCTGIMPVVHEIQRRLFQDLFSSFLSAVAVITLVMIIVQGGVIAGLLSVVSNVFPIVIVFGWLGWNNVPLDIGSVMTASVALGIAIDDALHLLTFFRRELDAGRSRFEALDKSLRSCGVAMANSTLIVLAGTTVFAMSDFVPTCRFAWMMLVLLLLTLLGDLVLLPALLISPLGRFFEPSVSETARPQSSGPDQIPGPRRVA